MPPITSGLKGSAYKTKRGKAEQRTDRASCASALRVAVSVAFCADSGHGCVCDRVLPSTTHELTSVPISDEVQAHAQAMLVFSNLGGPALCCGADYPIYREGARLFRRRSDR
jgi:hypothetical protein